MAIEEFNDWVEAPIDEQPEVAEVPNVDYEKVYVACRNLVKAALGRTWYPSQRKLALRIIKSLLLGEGEELVCEMTRQFGKSQLLGDLVYAMTMIVPTLGIAPFDRLFNVGIFAPKKDQSLIIFTKIKDNFDFRGSENLEAQELLGVTVEVSNGKEFHLRHGGRKSVRIVCESASDNASIEGFTAHLLILDECQDISEMKINKSIIPMGAATNATRVLIGTPNFEIGFLFKAVQRNFGKDTCIIVPYDIALREKYYIYKQNPKAQDARFHLNYKKFIDKQKRILGEDSDAWKTQFCMQWITERTRAITQSKLEELAEVWVKGPDGNDKPVMYSPLTSSANQVFVGIDIAKLIDATVVTVGGHFNPVTGAEDPENVYIYNWLHLQGDNYEDQYQYIKSFLDPYTNIKTVCLDETGVGGPVVDWFRKNFTRSRILGLKLSTQTNSDMYTLALQEMNNNRVNYPADKDTPLLRGFLREWIGLEKEYKGNLLKCESDPDDKYAHDDYCDSLAFLLYAIYQPGSSRFTYIGSLNNLLDAGKPAGTSQGPNTGPVAKFFRGNEWEDNWFDHETVKEAFTTSRKRRPEQQDRNEWF